MPQAIINDYPPPLSTTNAPKFAVPKGACDTHAHIFGPESRYPYAANRAYTPPDASIADFLRMLGALGVERSVIVQPSAYGTDNRRTADAVAELGMTRARGVAAIDSNTNTDTIAALDKSGIKAARFITYGSGGAAIEQLASVAQRIAQFGWHIEAYLPGRQWAELASIVETLPTQIVFDHMGGVSANAEENDAGLKAVLKLLDTGRFWVKLCGYRNSVTGYPYTDVAPLARRLAAHAPERCIWGSDWPHIGITEVMPDDGFLLDLLAEWVPDEGLRNRILVDNPAKLYGFT
jgi:predicted TIM-barrel fold metal-dependent hydrolase